MKPDPEMVSKFDQAIKALGMDRRERFSRSDVASIFVEMELVPDIDSAFVMLDQMVRDGIFEPQWMN